MDGEVTLKKEVMPHSVEAEQSVLGGLFIDNKKIGIVEEVLPDGSLFYNRQYGKIYDAMIALHDSGRPVDLTTLPVKLREMDVPPEVINAEFIADVVMGVPTSANVKYYADIVAEKALARELIHVTEDITQRAYADNQDIKDLLETTEKSVFRVVQKRRVGQVAPIKEVVLEAIDTIDRAARISGDVTGLPTGFIDLDKKTAGLQPGTLVLVAARPAMGKTSFVLSIAKHVVIKLKKPILIFSLEMSKVEMVNRLLAMDSHVDSQKFKTGSLTEAEWDDLVISSNNVAHSPLVLEDTATTIGEIRSLARKMKAEKDIQLLIIDYMQLMNSDSKRSESRQQEISEISRALKLLAKELKIPVIALSQLSRQVEGRTDHRPMLSDLRESGAIEQDADMVMFIYRDEVYKPDTDDKGVAEIIIAKHRSGPTGTVRLAWLPEYTQFANMAR